MHTIRRSWALTRTCWALLCRDKTLLGYPVVSAAAMCAALWACVAVTSHYLPAWRAWHGPPARMMAHPAWTIIGICVPILFLGSLVAVFCNAALTGSVLAYLENGEFSSGHGLQMARRRLGRICGWAVVSAVVGLSLALLKGKKKGADLPGVAGWLGEMTWSLATFLVMPVLVFEGCGPLAAVKRSASLLRKTWGEQVTFAVGMGTVMVAFMLPAGAIMALGLWAMSAGWLSWAVFVGIAGLLATYLIMTGVVFACLEKVYRAALYSFAVTDMMPDEFAPEFLPRPGR